MTYVTYTTKALVCGTFNRNTADCSYLLFTREVGMLVATARSVREERSRQRYSLQDFSLIYVSLIKGKSGWKIGSIEAQKNYYHLATDKTTRGNITSLTRLLRRFVKGEGAEPYLFDYVVMAFDELSNVVQENSFVLMVVQVHILAILGYVDKKVIPKDICQIKPSKIEQQYTKDIENKINTLYTHAVAMSHL